MLNQHHLRRHLEHECRAILRILHEENHPTMDTSRSGTAGTRPFLQLCCLIAHITKISCYHTKTLIGRDTGVKGCNWPMTSRRFSPPTIHGTKAWQPECLLLKNEDVPDRDIPTQSLFYWTIPSPHTSDPQANLIRLALRLRLPDFCARTDMWQIPPKGSLQQQESKQMTLL